MISSVFLFFVSSTPRPPPAFWRVCFEANLAQARQITNQLISRAGAFVRGVSLLLGRIGSRLDRYTAVEQTPPPHQPRKVAVVHRAAIYFHDRTPWTLLRCCSILVKEVSRCEVLLDIVLFALQYCLSVNSLLHRMETLIIWL